MTVLAACLILLLLMVLTLASYVDRLYSEMGKFLSREFQENIDVWEQHIEPGMGLTREHLALSSAVLAQMALAALTVLYVITAFDRSLTYSYSTATTLAQIIIGVALTVVFFNRLLPHMFFTRTRGLWLMRFRWPLRLLFYSVLPVTLLLGFLLSIVALVEQPPAREEAASEGVDALLEAGQEEGILEESDRDLVRSAVEFGDKITREVMTPRPRIFAVQARTTIETFLASLVANPYSRVPLYADTLDTIVGVVFAHDLLQISDIAAHTQPVSSIARPASFVPETKKTNELLREMQREKQHMRIVIDEYGGVSGLVTIEDLLEEIVGTISDEHEADEQDAPQQEPDGAWTVPGELELERLEQLLANGWQVPEDYEAATVAGLVSEVAGRIPLPGEVVEDNGLRFEILDSTDRRIERLRVSHAVPLA
jgi:putative hemolysin